MIKHGYCTGKIHYLNILWTNIKDRCYNKNCDLFKYYGMRGISMCNQWVDDFISFKNYIEEYLGERPEGCSLDRINNDGNYEPGNLRWATQKEQMRNTRRRYTVIRIDDKGNMVSYSCLQEVADDGFNKQNVWACLQGNRQTHGGFQWLKQN